MSTPVYGSDSFAYDFESALAEAKVAEREEQLQFPRLPRSCVTCGAHFERARRQPCASTSTCAERTCIASR
jgi:hypothetical protein